MIKKYSFPIFLTLGIFWAELAKAICPVCVVAVGAGVGLSRWLGIDDLISGIWIGALTVAVSAWTLDWLFKKQISFRYKNFIVYFGYYFLILASLHFPRILWHPLNKFLGIDKIIFGIVSGSIIFIAGVALNGHLKKKNEGKQYFIYQKVVIPVSLLIITSIIFYFILQWK